MKKERNFKPQDSEYWKKRPIDDPKKDWPYGGDWVETYWKSREHPHRSLILNAIESLRPIGSILEIGCSCGPNLANIGDRHHGIKLSGIDANKTAIARGKELLPNADLRVGFATKLPFKNESYDLIVVDAVLIYVPPEDILQVITEIDRVVKRAVLLVEWHNEDSILGIVKDFHWCRNYHRIFRRLGFKVEMHRFNKDSWPSKTWQKHGRLYLCRRKKL